MFEIETSIAEGRPLRRSYERQMRSKPRELANEPNLDAGMAPIQDIIRIYVKSFHKPSGTLDNVARNAKGRPGAGSGGGTEEPRKNRNTRKWSSDSRDHRSRAELSDHGACEGVAPLMFMGRGKRANLQNEIGRRISTGRSRGSAVAPSRASGKCALVHLGRRPRPSLLPPLICELRVDLIVPTPTWSLIHGCMRPRDRSLRVKFKLMERPLFRTVQTLEKCSRSAKKCKKNGRSNQSRNEDEQSVCRFEIGGSDLRCTDSHLQDSDLHSMAESAMSNRTSCSLCQTDVQPLACGSADGTAECACYSDSLSRRGWGWRSRFQCQPEA